MPTNLENEALETLTKTGGEARRVVPHTAVDRYGRPLVYISGGSLGLPSGAATEAKQDDGIALLTTIDADTSALAAVDYATQTTLAAILTELQAKADLAETQPVSAASLPLPSGASTAALQTTANGLLTTIDADTGSIAGSASTIAGDTTSIDGKITACDTDSVTVVAMPTVDIDFPAVSTVTSDKSGSTITVTTSSTALASSNSSREVLIVQNQSNVDVYVCLKGTATVASAFYCLHSIGSTCIIPGHLHTGAVSAIVASGTPSVIVFEQNV